MKTDKRHILILEAGGPCGISAIKLLKKNKIGTIIAADMDKYSPAFTLADTFYVVPKATDLSYAKVIQEIITREGIDLVLPTFENGFSSLSKIDTNTFLMDFNSALLCKNKLAFNQFAKDKKLPVPETQLLVDVVKVNKPLYVKPIYGVGSRNNFIVQNYDDFRKLIAFVENPGDYIAQDMLQGTHWNVDVLVLDGEFITAIPRKDLKQKDGNCITVSVENNKEIVAFSKDVQKRLNIKSPFNLELFDTKKGFVINEINVRFGGGVIFGALSGIDIVSYSVTREKKYLGKLKNVCYSRYYEELELKHNI